MSTDSRTSSPARRNPGHGNPGSAAGPDAAALAARGAARIDWIRSRMPLLAEARAALAATRPFDGHLIGMSLHLEPKTAVLLETLQAGGAEIVATGNHGSTQDDVVAYLRTLGMTVHGRRADTLDDHSANVAAVDAARPSILLDNGQTSPRSPPRASTRRPLPEETRRAARASSAERRRPRAEGCGCAPSSRRASRSRCS